MASNKNTLFITDLDGTLLNDSSILTSDTLASIKAFAKNGILITFATSRGSISNIKTILPKGIFSIPAILMNGALVYDINNEEIIAYSILPKNCVKKIIEIVKKIDIGAIIYFCDRCTLKTQIIPPSVHNKEKLHKYTGLTHPSDKYEITNSIKDNDLNNCIYIAVTGSVEVINSFYSKIQNIEGVDIYHYIENKYEDSAFAEIVCMGTSKASAAKILLKKYYCRYLVSFGDNENDIPLFNISDECYAVANAIPELKKIATGIIDTNNVNAVAVWMNENINSIYL
jgi:Cof subfamily protein (haloacid dehalogenase superfamily)